jgi:hypothetical protein
MTGLGFDATSYGVHTSNHGTTKQHLEHMCCNIGI